LLDLELDWGQIDMLENPWVGQPRPGGQIGPGTSG